MRQTSSSTFSGPFRSRSSSSSSTLRLLLSSALAPTTKRAYRTALIRFCRASCTAFPDLPCLSHPSHHTTIMLFIAHLFETGLAPTSITSHLSAISFWHEIHQWHNPTRHPLVQKLLHGVRNSHTPSISRSPITIPVLRQLFHSLSHPSFTPFTALLLSSIFSLSFYAFLRVGEFTLSPHTIQISDCHLSSQSSITISFRSFKFSRNQTPHIILPAAGHSLCPVFHLSRYLSVRPPRPGALFLLESGHPLTPRLFSQYLSQACLHASLDASKIKPHSFRIGAATTAAALGIPTDTIQRMGRWSSHAFQRYIRIQVNRL